nr:MAG TPA: hypothetical protein [Caudoviricetes sp.]
MLLISLHEMDIIWVEYYYRHNSRRYHYEYSSIRSNSPELQ